MWTHRTDPGGRTERVKAMNMNSAPSLKRDGIRIFTTRFYSCYYSAASEPATFDRLLGQWAVLVFASAGTDWSPAGCHLVESSRSDSLFPHFLLLQLDSKIDDNYSPLKIRSTWILPVSYKPATCIGFCLDHAGVWLVDFCRHDLPLLLSLSLSLENSRAFRFSSHASCFCLCVCGFSPPPPAIPPLLLNCWCWFSFGYFNRPVTSLSSRESSLQWVNRVPVLPAVFPSVLDVFSCW